MRRIMPLIGLCLIIIAIVIAAVMMGMSEMQSPALLLIGAVIFGLFTASVVPGFVAAVRLAFPIKSNPQEHRAP